MTDDHETWLIEEGHAVIERKGGSGYAGLTDLQRLIYCLWVSDYGMRNAGDLATAEDLFPNFATDGSDLATRLNLPKASHAFSLPLRQLEKSYFDLFDPLIEEVRGAFEAERLNNNG